MNEYVKFAKRFMDELEKERERLQILSIREQEKGVSMNIYSKSFVEKCRELPVISTEYHRGGWSVTVRIEDGVVATAHLNRESLIKFFNGDKEARENVKSA